MKKSIYTLTAISLLMSATTTFADVKVAAMPTVPFNGSDYVGVIQAASFNNTKIDGSPKVIRIMTSVDEKSGGQIKGLTLDINNDDLPLGFTLANSVGKKVSVTFSNAAYDIAYVNIVTDEYYYGKK